MPQGVSRIELKFRFPSPGSAGEFGQSVSATSRLVDLEWNQVVFYPAGYYSCALVAAARPGAGLFEIARGAAAPRSLDPPRGARHTRAPRCIGRAA
ncbi:hypothetical protein [Metallibacterium sp.]|uniref:hypothetical protein n=1 Tax=Metallibacterium sp. TaxID=2940281 RepID=UPI002606E455|nr:hypothetical protein [Metallibacterium sp.]